MKKIILTIILSMPLSNYAAGVSVIKDKQGMWDVFYTAANGNKYFIYKDQYQIDAASGDGQSLFYQTRGNIFYIMYGCYHEQDYSCIRYINLATGQISRVIHNPALSVDANQNLLGPIDNLKQNVILIFNYPEDWQYTVIPIFQACKHPFVYQVKHLSMGTDVGSAFLPNGDLYLNIPWDAYPSSAVTVPIDYDKLYKNCN